MSSKELKINSSKNVGPQPGMAWKIWVWGGSFDLASGPWAMVCYRGLLLLPYLKTSQFFKSNCTLTSNFQVQTHTLCERIPRSFFFFISRIFSTKSTEHQSEIQNMYLIPISEKSWEKMQGYPLGYAKSLSLSYGQSYHLDQFKTLEHQAFSIRFFELEWFRSPELHFDHFRLLVVWVGLKSAKMVVGSLHSTQRVSLPASLPFLQLFEKGEKTQHLVLSAMISIESNYTAADWNHQLNF